MLRERKQLRRFYVLLPLFGLLSCLGIINLMPHRGAVASVAPSVAPTRAALRSTPRPSLEPVTTVATPPTATATRAPTPVPTATPTPTLPPHAAILLLGPPDGAVLDLSRDVAFYWETNIVPPDDAWFELDFLTATAAKSAGALPRPSVGGVNFLLLRPAAVTDPEDIIGWQVRLVAPAGHNLLAGEPRALRHVTP